MLICSHLCNGYRHVFPTTVLFCHFCLPFPFIFLLKALAKCIRCNLTFLEVLCAQFIKLQNKMCMVAHLLFFQDLFSFLRCEFSFSFYTIKISFFWTCRGDRSYKPNPRLARVLDVLFILHAEHEMNCSTSAARHLASRYHLSTKQK